MRFLERDWMSSNQILFFDPDGATVVDTGYFKHLALTVALLRRELRLRGSLPLTRIINTHLHSDHCGGNAALARAFAADAPAIAIPIGEAQTVASWASERMNATLCGQPLERFSASQSIAPGDELPLGGLRWIAHASPGHDPNSLILYCPSKRILISADALWEHGYGISFPELAGESGFAEQRAVLDLITKLKVDLVLPGHGPAFADVKSALRRAYQRIDAQQADGSKHARHSIKSMIKFQLMDREQIDYQALRALCHDIVIVQQGCRILGEAPGTMMDLLTDELIAQGAARRDGDLLYNL
jgi:glyoxylase-like metal-dependent hydrolase (beta-lactamase superfamily II)